MSRRALKVRVPRLVAGNVGHAFGSGARLLQIVANQLQANGHTALPETARHAHAGQAGQRSRQCEDVGQIVGQRIVAVAAELPGNRGRHGADGRVVFVAFAAPGELVEAQVEREYPEYIQAVTTRVIEPSSDRVEPRCPLFGECGGCQLQHMSYPAQLAAKEAVVREQLRRIGKLDDSVVRPIVGAAEPWGYRNHLRFSTGKKYGDVGYIGRKGYGLLKVDSCPIADPWVSDLLPKLQGHGAGLHQVQVRYSAETGTGLINPAIPDVPFETGQKAYVEELAGRRFDVSASAFFQVNHAQAEQMVRLVGEALPERGDLLIDGFAGVGTFAVIYSDRFERVLAIEESNSAAKDSERNLAQAPNVEMLVGKVEDILPDLEVRPDAIILDPPRPGCAPPVMRAILEFQPSLSVI